MSVAKAVKRDIADIRKRDRALGDSALAASALVLAEQLDDPGNSATAKSMCARALREALDRLRELAPARKESDDVDDLAKRRARRRTAARRTATPHKAGS
jgi:hypothetical protein